MENEFSVAENEGKLCVKDAIPPVAIMPLA